MNRVSVIPGSSTIVTGEKLLLVESTVNPDVVQQQFLLGVETAVVYTGVLGYVRWKSPMTDVLPPNAQPGEVENSLTTFDDLFASPDFSSRVPWWGDVQAAEAIALELGIAFQQGDPSLGTPNGGFFGPYFAYGTNQNGSVEVVTWQGTSGTLTQGTVVNPGDSLTYAVQGDSAGVLVRDLTGPWVPIYQASVALPVEGPDLPNLMFEAVTNVGVSMELTPVEVVV